MVILRKNTLLFIEYSFNLDCSALELAISEHRLWLLTSHGQIQCRENISLENPIGTRSATLSGHFRSLTGEIENEEKENKKRKLSLLFFSFIG